MASVTRLACPTPQLRVCLRQQEHRPAFNRWLVGHTTEEMRRRYRHLYPSTQAEAIQRVFG